MSAAASRISAWKQALCVFIPVRILASLAALIANAGIPSQITISAGGYSKPAYPRILEVFFGVWERSDALWYFHIARDGYQPGSADAVFMPLYPFLIRGVHALSGLPWLYSGLLASNIAFIIALIGFRKLAESEVGAEAAERACWYLALFPGSFFFLAPYTESLFLALAVWALLWARRGCWWRAGLAGLFLALTRNLGAVILLPLIAELVLQLRRERPPIVRWLKNTAALSLIVIGPVAWSLYFHFVSGDAFAWIRHQDNWGRVAMPPWETLAGGIRQAWDYGAGLPGAVYLLEAASILMALTVLICGTVRRKIAVSELILGIVLLLPPLAAPYPGRMLLSSTRFVAVVFPVFILLAAWIKKPAVDGGVRIVFAGLYSLALALYVSNQNMF